ncbi:hypothetical protein [Botrimarina mediterranea]|uniref:hypothetical protein n=1 Tax=Botrimarina mediterranea TaxID=2528022 RepID=UPI00118C1843|nr:hypothetical protein K2D_11040 [Planctomycetes bacterium K2D]
MHPFRVVRRLLSRAHEDWQDAVEGLFAAPPRRPMGPRPLRVMRLERRRVLSADFSLTATGLVLSGFDDAGGDTLAVQQDGDDYLFTSGNGWEQHEPNQLPEGVTIDGDTLSIDRALLEGLEDGLTIEGSLGHQLDVRLGDADFSGLSGPVTLDGVTSVGQEQPFALVTAPTDGFQLIVAPSGTVLSSLNVSGDLNIVSIGGSITDVSGSEILISGNATFTSRAASPAGDFNGDGIVDDVDRTEHWAKNYGMTSGATKYHGDANGDGRIDAADYTAWRDTLGQMGQGGIELANEAGDRLVIGGVATFDAAEPEGTHDIYVGVGGVAEFGSVNAYGANVIIHEDATAGDSGPTTVLGSIEAYTLQVESGGKITNSFGAPIAVQGDASFVVTEAAMIADGPLAQAIVLNIPTPAITRLTIGGVATFIVEQPTTQIEGFGGPKGIDVAVGMDGRFAGGFNAGSLRFYAPDATVRIAEDSDAVLAGWGAGDRVDASVAHTLELQSRLGMISDDADAVVRISGDAAFYSDTTMVLADGGAANTLSVDGLATFVQNPDAAGIDVGVTSAGAAAAATFNTGTLRFSSSRGVVRIAEDSSTVLVGWSTTPGPTGFPYLFYPISSAPSALALELTSAGSITDEADSSINVGSATFVAKDEIVLADSDLFDPFDTFYNRLRVSGVATFISTDGDDISVGVGAAGSAAVAWFEAGSIRFVSVGGDVRIAEDSSTVLAGWASDTIAPSIPLPTPTISVAGNLELFSFGTIVDEPNAAVRVAGDATFVAKDQIVLADSDTFENRITVSGVATFISTDGDGISVGVGGTGAPAAAFFHAGSIRFVSVGGDVRIAQAGSINALHGNMLLADWAADSIAPSIPIPTPTASVAENLELSAVVIADEANAVVNVTGDATFVASQSIVLADADNPGGSNSLTVGGVATFVTGNYFGALRVGATEDGAPSAAVFQAGGLRFSAPNGVVQIAEDDGTHLVDWRTTPVSPLIVRPRTVTEARVIELSSAGGITDADGAVVFATGWNGSERVYGYSGATATFVAAESITLADGGADNKLMVDGLLTLVSTAASGQRIDVGVTPTGGMANAEFIAGSVRFWAPEGAVRLVEDTAINLGGATYSENYGTMIGSWATGAESPLFPSSVVSNRAGTLDLVSYWIADESNAVVEVSGDAGFRAIGPSIGSPLIQLADGGVSNALRVGGVATFVVDAAFGVDVGGGIGLAEFVAGSLRFNAGGAVRIAEDSATHLADWGGLAVGLIRPDASMNRSVAASLDLNSAGAITDAADAKVLIAGDAKFTVSTIASVAGPAAIVLADGDAANELVVGGHANFIVNQVPAGSPKGIDVGVVPATGAPAAALFTAGTLGFSAQGGMVRLAEDNDTVLGGLSTAQDLELLSAGFITDTDSVTTGEIVAATSVEVTQTAKLKAGLNGENNVTLGAGAAAFSMADSDGNNPQLFNDAQYLAVQAENVSIHADSGVNVRTGDAPLSNLDNYSQFAGTFYLAATGHVTQVTTAAPKALAADKISVASDNGAVLLRLVELTSTGTDPNLQIKSGGSVALSQPLVGGGTVGGKFAGSDIPSPTSPAFAPVIVEADDPLTGVRPDMPARSGDEGFEDVLLTGGENARLSEAVRLPNGDYVVDHLLEDGGQTRTIDDLYTMIVVVSGDANVGDVHDPNTDARRDVDAAEARGVAVEDGGNAFLATTAGGDLFFTNRNREGGDELDGIAVQMAGGVFTAIAAGTLRIDTEDPDNLATGLRTTRLVSRTGTVTNVNSDDPNGFGPRAILDPSTEEGNAATSGLVRADQNFEQRVTMALGSRGEDNLLVEVEWADTADIRQYSNANVRLAPGPNLPTNTVGSTDVPGSRPYADVVQTPVETIEANVADPSLTGYQYQTLAGASRVATITHNYDEAFVPNNPAQNRLPTTVRVFNDAAINLFDQGGARNLNSVSFSIAPRIITLPPPGYFIISEPDLPQQYEPVSVTLPRSEPTQVTQQTTLDEGRAVSVSTTEEVWYGRVDEQGDWVVDIPGEKWPRIHEDAEGDFLREIRDKIDEGPYSEGRYVIKVVTLRSEQLLEEWVKGDDAEADDGMATKPSAVPTTDGPAAEGPAEEADLPAEEARPATPAVNGPGEAPAVVAPQGAPLGLLELESAPVDARHTAFAAMAAVGVWRRRLNDAGPFTLDADGVAFTRVKRQRRRRGGE